MSAILSADDLNDFISPGVACIKPIETLPAAKPTGESEAFEVSFNNEPTNPSNLPPAQISLTDCLACSGCVTSAEAVLVSLQSHTEVLQALDSAPGLRLHRDSAGGIGVEGLESGGQLFVASVSPQTRASIAATFGVSELEAGYMIEQLLNGPKGIKSRAVYRNGFQWVVDTNVAREACLVLGAEEVIGSLQKESDGVEPKKPILTSSCPGWICYAEKTHPYVLPHLSRLKSPQALMGTILKTTLSRKLGISPDRIWHLAIMPCFDKKLEASREELTDTAWDGSNGKGVRDVDCVITSKELLMLADSRRVDFRSLPRSPLSPAYQLPFPDQNLQSFLFPAFRRRGGNFEPAAGTSGGNLYYILKYLEARYPGASIQSIRGRNADVLEYTVTSADGNTLFKAARYYGFRNIQNLVRRLKPSKPSRLPGARPVGGAKKTGGKTSSPEFSYVEVMACPGGCTNGGGQIKVDDPIITGSEPTGEKPGPQAQKDWLAQVDEAYFSGEETKNREEEDAMDVDQPDDTVNGISPSQVKKAMAHWADIVGVDLDRLVYTSYREVVSDVGKKANDTERAIEIASKADGGW
ncbi:cytosolic Fe-S cluster assembly factor NAR1 [Xylogone sp. PMI_703]|nr:cytosolic Fe-S cluster assembly factor NAR1 [Xylogone sp. PMI_703]